MTLTVVAKKAGGESKNFLPGEHRWLVDFHLGLHSFLLRVLLASEGGEIERLETEIQIKGGCADGNSKCIPVDSDLERRPDDRQTDGQIPAGSVPLPLVRGLAGHSSNIPTNRNIIIRT